MVVKERTGSKKQERGAPAVGRPSVWAYLTHRSQTDPVWRLWHYARPHKKRVILGCLSGIVMSLIMIGVGALIQGMMDAMKDGKPELITLFAASTPFVFAAKGLFYYGQVYLLSNVSERVGQTLRNNLFEHMERLSLGFYESRKVGGLFATISTDVPVIQQQMSQILMEGLTAPVVVVAGVTYMMFVDWRLACATWVTLILVGVVISRAGKRMRAASESVQKSLGATSGLATELLSAIRVIRSFGTEEREAARFREESARTYAANMKVVQINGVLRPVVELLGALSIAFVLWFGGMLIAKESLELGEVITVLYVTNLVTVSLNQIGRFGAYLARIHGAAQRVFEVLDIQPEIQDASDARTLEHVEGRITFDNVVFGYADGDPVLRGLAFEMRPGECIALVGPSGVGKSTIANLIPRFYDVTGGAIRVDGHDVREVTAHSLRDHIGIVAQEPVLFSGSIRENIAYGRPDATEDEVLAAARAANADGFITTMLPEGYDTLVGERGVKLSGGQRQRIAIARALLKDPRILILDEATSALDAESEALVQEALDKLMQGRTTIIIAHRLSTVRKADRILALDGGRVAEQGTHAELLRRNGLYARLYERGLGDTDSGSRNGDCGLGNGSQDATPVAQAPVGALAAATGNSQSEIRNPKSSGG